MNDEENLCAVCGHTLIAGCKNAVGGGGNIITLTEDGEQMVKLCPNVKRLSIKQYLANIEPRMAKPEILHNKNSPLFQPGELDLTTENMFFRSTNWNVFLSNLKWVAAYKFKRNMFIRVVTDLHLINVYVGNTSVKARLKSQQIEDGPLQICNSLPDLLEGPDLVIIKLGVLTHSNKAAANVLSEALLIRSSVAKPTWVVEPDHKKFEPYQRAEYGTTYGMPSCNEDVLEYLEENFDQLTLEAVEGVEADVTPAVEMTAEVPEDMDAEMGEAVEGIPDEDEEDEEQPDKDISDEDMSDLLGEDFDKPDWMKKKNKKSKGRFGR